ncbi:MAG: peptidase [Firmicutes bacterium]|nr:peptidase [Bacillota bacterium]
MADVTDRTKRWSQGRLRERPRKKGDEMSPGERRRVNQLLACIVLFGVVFLGQGIPLGRLTELGTTVGALIHQNTDFRQVFSKVGQSVSEGEPFVQTFGTIWSEVFSTDGEEPADAALPEDVLTGTGSPAGTVVPGDGVESHPIQETPPAEETPVVEPVPAAPETVSPVMGVLTSGFGPRVHPIDGELKEHNGVDIMVDEGTPILAYAAGEVDYVGESPEYGLYLQLKHKDGLTTFYAHCKDICVKKGQQVAVGEKIGEVGETGNVTGVHLHFEMRQDGSLMDPMPYIKTLT